MLQSDKNVLESFELRLGSDGIEVVIGFPRFQIGEPVSQSVAQLTQGFFFGLGPLLVTADLRVQAGQLVVEEPRPLVP